MKYTVWKITRSHGKGCPEDGSESWENEVSWEVVPENKEEEFGDFIADECGSQDYSYQFGYMRQGDFYSDREINSIDELNTEELEYINMGKCSKCGSVNAICRGENFVYNDNTKEWLCLDCDACKDDKKLKVCWSSSVPIENLETYEVANIDDAIKKYQELTNRDLADNSVTDNVGGCEIFENGEWCEFYDGDGNDIDAIIRQIEDTLCPACNSDNVKESFIINHYECNDCEYTWRIEDN